jgi:hypothetical protein
MARPSPSARRSAGAACYDGAFHVLGGFGVRGTAQPDDVGADLWRYDASWSLVAQDGPPPARFPSLCATPEGIYRFGGCGHDERGLRFLAELWLYDNVWRVVEPTAGPCPAARYTSALAWHDGRLVLFGGQAQSPTGARKVFFDDLWLFDGGSGSWPRSWRRVAADGGGPGPRYGIGWVASGGTLYLFGGFDGHADRGDLWALDLERFRWRLLAADGPPPRYCPALGMVEDRLVLFGGRSKTNAKLNFADTWVFSGSWRELDDPGPGYHAKPAYASGGGGLWMFGGEGPRGHVSDLWRFDANGWRRLARARTDDPVLW